MKENVVRRLVVLIPPQRAAILASGSARSPFSSATVVRFLTEDSRGGAGRQTAGEAPVALLPKAQSVELAFDAVDVFSGEVNAPRLAEAKLRLALPNLLEDRLLSSADELHFAYGTATLSRPARRESSGESVFGATRLEPSTRLGQATATLSRPTATASRPLAQESQPGQTLAVAAIDRGWLTRVLDACNESGIRPRLAYSRIYTVTPPPAGAGGFLGVQVDRGRCTLRTGAHEGLAFDLDEHAGTSLGIAMARSGAHELRVWGEEAEAVANLAFAPLADGSAPAVSGQGRLFDLQAADDALNLLQGNFSASGRLAFGPGLAKFVRSNLWQAPLAWLCAMGLVAVVGLNAYWLKLDGEARSLRSGMTSAFRATFPEVPTVVDPVRQAQQQVETLRSRAGIASAGDFAVLDTQAVQLFGDPSVPVGAVTAIEYKDGVLKLTLRPQVDSPELHAGLHARAAQLGLDLSFAADGSARLAPAGS